MKQYLSESLTSIVYFYCNINTLTDILTTNQFHLESNLGTSADQIPHTKGYHYFFSTSRIFYGGYVRGNLRDGGVIITLNGDKFNERYHSVPVDYWGEDYRKGARESGDNNTYFRNDENEDRILSNKENIPNAIDYIIAVDYCVWSEYSKKDSYQDVDTSGSPTSTLYRRFVNSQYKLPIRNSYTFLTKKGIKCTVYLDAEDFVKRNNKNTIKASLEMSDYVQELVDYLENKIPLDNNGNMSYDKKYQHIVGAIKSQWENREFAKSLANEIHNQKTDTYSRHNIQIITNAMVQHKASNLQELMEKLYQEYEEAHQQGDKIKNIMNPLG